MLYGEEFLAELETQLRATLPAWGLPPHSSLRLLTISENATYLVQHEGAEKVIFRVYRPGYNSRDEILSELDWIAALRDEQAIDTPAPVAGLDGRLLHPLRGAREERFAACFQYVDGHAPSADDDLPPWFRVLGAVTARLHRQARHFTPPAGFARRKWDWTTIIGPSADWGDWRAARELDAEGRAVLEKTAEKLRLRTEAYGKDSDRFGLIHCDMRAANLLVDGDRLWVIDFDDCGFSWYGYDFAASVSFIEHEPILPDLMSAWIEGYRSVAPLDAATVAALPMFVMLRRMQLTAWLASHAETPMARELPPGYTQGTVALARAWLEREDTP